MCAGGYGVMFAVGVAGACYFVWFRWRDAGWSERGYGWFVVMVFAGMMVGARLCHCLCYEPGYFLGHVWEMLLPIGRDGMGVYRFTGYHGLASHGGAAGAVAGVLVYGAVWGRDVRLMLDWAGVATLLLGGCVRVGNFLNEEIVGVETGLPWGVVFESVDMVRRHPAQLYEAVYYFVLFGVVAWCYRRFGYGRVMPLFYCGVVMVAVGVFRMGIECVKEVQVAAEVGMWWNLGQWLSVPFVVAGVVMVAVTGVFAARRGE